MNSVLFRDKLIVTESPDFACIDKLGIDFSLRSPEVSSQV